MKKSLVLFLLCACLPITAKTVPFGKGQLTIKTVAKNAVRIQYIEDKTNDVLPDWLYVKHDEVVSKDIKVEVDAKRQVVTIKNKNGQTVFTATRHQLQHQEATLTIASPQDEYLFGLGQFQDGYANIRQLPRRLTQVNTQISIPMMVSSKGYGILWNNYGLTDFNPADQSVRLVKREGNGEREEVNVTSTEGGKKEIRERHIFEVTIDVK